MRARRSPNATDIGISLHIVHADQEIECRDAVQQPPININIDVNKSSYRSRYKHVYILVTLLASFSVFSFIFRTRSCLFSPWLKHCGLWRIYGGGVASSLLGNDQELQSLVVGINGG